MEGNNIINFKEEVAKRNAAKNPQHEQTTALNETTIEAPRPKGSWFDKLLGRKPHTENSNPNEPQAAANPVNAINKSEPNSTQTMTPIPEPNPVIARIDEMITPSPTLGENPDGKILQFPPQSELDRREEAKAPTTIAQEQAARTQQATQAITEQPSTAADSQSSENEDPAAEFLEQQMDAGDNKPVA